MTGYCVVVTELARARIFTLESSDAPEVENSPYLLERKTLINPQHKAHEGDIWEETRRGAHREHQGSQSGRQPTGIPHQNFDEHRDNNERRANERFARDVVADLKEVVERHNIQHVVLCAENQMLGALRPKLEALSTDKIRLDEVNKDLTNLSSRELHKKLADDDLLPRPKRPPITGQSQTRGQANG